MSDNIITLTNVRRSGVVVPETGVTFPQLYRLSGKVWQLKDGAVMNGCMLKSRDDIEPSAELAVPQYTLKYGVQYEELAEPNWAPIDHLDTLFDTGWVVVRHHLSRQAAEGYVDAMFDAGPRDVSSKRWGLFETELGFFSVLNRAAPPGTRDCLLVYVSKVDSLFGPMDWVHVVGVEGEVFDENALYPVEDIAYYQPLIDHLNGDDA